MLEVELAGIRFLDPKDKKYIGTLDYVSQPVIAKWYEKECEVDEDTNLCSILANLYRDCDEEKVKADLEKGVKIKARIRLFADMDWRDGHWFNYQHVELDRKYEVEKKIEGEAKAE